MCLVRTPKPVPQQTQGEAKKKLQVLRNRDLDGIDPMIRARALGSGSFRIDRGTGTNPPIPGSTAATPRPGTLPITRVPTGSPGGTLQILPGPRAPKRKATQ